MHLMMRNGYNYSYVVKMRYLGFKMNSDLRLTASQVHVVDGSRRDLTAELEEHLLVPVGNNDRLDEYSMKGENA